MTCRKFDYIVVGAGITGLSVVDHLRARNYKVGIVDGRQEPPAKNKLKLDYDDIECHFGGFDVDWQAPILVLSPGIAPSDFTNLYGSKKTIGDIELFAHENTLPIIAITGTNGKSTLVSLIEHACKQTGIKAKCGGNIGIPALTLLSDTSLELIILELSSFQLETTTSLQSKVAIITNITPDHMDRYNDFDAYKLAKQRIFMNSKYAVVNSDDAHTKPLHAMQTINITYHKPTTDEWGIWVDEHTKEEKIFHGKKPIFSTSSLALQNKHNIMNSLAALAVADVCKWPLIPFIAGLKSFTGLPHRLQKVAETNGITFINDSKATNIGATLAALTAVGEKQISKKILLLLGGDGKGADFSMLISSMKQYAKLCLVYGNDNSIDNTMTQHNVRFTRTQTLAQAIIIAYGQAQDGDIVLLSPACASFDQFANFEARGQEFIRVVQEIVDSKNRGNRHAS